MLKTADLLLASSDPSKSNSERLASLRTWLAWHPRHRQILQSLRALMATVDSGGLDALRRQYAEPMRKASPASRYKYLDVVYFTLAKLLLAHSLGLNTGPPRRVLDIGTGGGHFPLVCRHFGHQVVAIDVEDKFYDAIASCLGVHRTKVLVEARTRLPELGGKFDLITANDIIFNYKGKHLGRRHYWSLEEWQFFFDDLLANQLRSPGALYLKLNRERRGRVLGVDRFVTNHEVLALAARIGAATNRRSGTISLTLKSQRPPQ